MSNFDWFYAEALESIMSWDISMNERTGHRVKAEAGVILATTKPPFLQLRDINPKWFVVEVVASLLGDRDLHLFHHYGLKAWDKFVDDDGNVESMYGWRWRRQFDRDQLLDLVTGLETDPTSRHGVLMTWDPRSDGLCREPVPNIPCLIAWHFHIIHGNLYLSMLQRSGDMVVGVPHDIAGGWLLLEIIAAHLGLGVGHLTHVVSNAHVYESHFDIVRQMVDNLPKVREMEISRLMVERDTFNVIVFDNNATQMVDYLYSKIMSRYRPAEVDGRPEVIL